mmetsp:Transcript_13907/g.28587  ORF Transcript_13907/g.28587 Transcript_13907/m.28587 type:complete len:197 (-) Transcript_13907:141-731(-)|eukprot:CAMPEP_0183305142 /NCGR_PEP_ID=MMETSP0160_2-20130417/9982_1 /TAXON_ID=2839 ORGANISM="Odontella Sinensis, Strain Grunow 1884" /NCGR_SAMPLE_ID=MMETSP0160_2 /ASSEMBLY_ACC=CAM_ASM_000250 /LENGTH=196 /DNA_ID=CAMNT_0025468303 /DNA_START=163 /DNA_END=753 /DNA_ORIENTATION=-
MAPSPSEPIACFLAGALIPTLAYALFFRKGGNGASKDEEIRIDDDGYDEVESESSDDEGDVDLGEGPNSTVPKSWGMKDAPYKMVLCVDTSLGMGKGKIAAQCCHAAVGCYKRAKKLCPAGLRAWEMTGCAKIAVKVPSQDEMEAILLAAHERGLPLYMVADAGRTQIAAGSRTVLGIGPAPVYAFEGVTSHLKLM